MRYCLLLLFGLALPCRAAAQQRPAPANTVATQLQLPGADCALFPAAIGLTPPFERKLAAGGRFTPTIQQVTASEKSLPSVRLLALCPQPASREDAQFAATFKKHLKSYRRQYYGFYNAQHEPCLYINFFIRQPSNEDYWPSQRVHVIDAGYSIWSLCYNLTSKTFYNFDHEFSTRF